MARVFKSFSTTSDKATETGHLYDVDCIIEDIKNLIKTRKGEYPMDVDRGCIVHDYIHNPSLNGSEKQLIIDDLEEQLGTDKRIANLEVFIEELSSGYYVMINATLLPMNTDINLQIDLED